MTRIRVAWMTLALVLVSSASFAQGSETVVYFHADAVGSTRLVTDANGVVVETHDYLPFGEPWASSGLETRRFGGKERDSETGLDYFGARYYSSLNGRFTAVDPKMDITQAVNDPQGWNRYAYARNNPFRFYDPDGRETQLLFGRYTNDNPFGHVAIAINGVVFSYGTNWTKGPQGQRDWGADAAKYLEAQDDVRRTDVLTLDISADEEAALLGNLKNSNPYAPSAPAYQTPFHTCVTVCYTALQGIAALPQLLRADGDPNAGAIGPPLTPAGLKAEVKKRGLVKEETTVGTDPKSSWWGSVWNAIVDQFN
jgi:RHS repeat-associated protein